MVKVKLAYAREEAILAGISCPQSDGKPNQMVAGIVRRSLAKFFKENIRQASAHPSNKSGRLE